MLTSLVHDILLKVAFEGKHDRESNSSKIKPTDPGELVNAMGILSNGETHLSSGK